MKIFSALGVSGFLFLATWHQPALAQETKPASPADTAGATNNAAADKAWKEFEKALTNPPSPPDAWRERKPTEEEKKKFQTQQRTLAVKVADMAHDFYTTFPTNAKAPEARQQERRLLGFAVQMGDTNSVARLDKLEKDQLKDPNLTEDEKFELRAQAVERAAGEKQDEGMEAVFKELEKGARELQKDFPKRPEIYEMLFMIASNSTGDKARALANEIIKSDVASEQLHTEANALLKKLDALGKPLELKFTALDGKEVDLAKMKGKVVLVDFWATWCGPCVAELPNVKAAYEKLHTNGFEIVGISFDQSKEKLTDFLKEEKMTWPQYFDGEGWKNKFGQEFGINSIPAMWLVDKKGILRDQQGRTDLEKKVEQFLAE